MGRTPRPRPARLAAKLCRIRRALGLTQAGLLMRLDFRQSALRAHHLSEFEQGKREPPLGLLLRYARLAGVPLELLVDDEMELPADLPRDPPEAGRAAAVAPARPEPPGVVDGSPTTRQEGVCPYCGATRRQAKAGRLPGGEQRYLCQVCHRRYTPRARANSYPAEVRRQAVRLHLDGLSFSRVGRALGVSPQSVSNWVNAHLARAVEPRRDPPGAPEVIERAG